MTHTPGPYHHKQDYGTKYIIKAADGREVGAAHGKDNARLFAAAPDLLWLVQNRTRYTRINAMRDAGQTVASFKKEFVASYERREHDTIKKATQCETS